MALVMLMVSSQRAFSRSPLAFCVQLVKKAKNKTKHHGTYDKNVSCGAPSWINPASFRFSFFIARDRAAVEQRNARDDVILHSNVGLVVLSLQLISYVQ